MKLSDLWGEVARQYGGPYLEAAATGGNTSTIIDTANLKNYSDDHWNHAWACIVEDAGGASAAPEGETRLVSDFVQSTGIVTVSPVFTAAVAADDTYRLWAGMSRPEHVDAVKSALRAAYPSFYQRVVDETLVTVASTYEYTVPAAIEHLQEVWIQGDSDATYYTPLRDWRVEKTGASTRKLILSEKHSYTSTYTLRCIGTGPLDCPATDEATLTIEAEYQDSLLEFVGLYGAALAHRWMSMRDKDNVREHLTLRDALQAEAARALRKGMPAQPGRVRMTYPAYWSN